MGLKKLLKKISCKLFFCMGSKCSYNSNGKGQLKFDFKEEKILDNIINDKSQEIYKVNQITSDLYEEV